MVLVTCKDAKTSLIDSNYRRWCQFVMPTLLSIVEYNQGKWRPKARINNVIFSIFHDTFPQLMY
jgi:hypothetical protein